MSDPVSAPSHYTDGPIEAIDAIASALGPEGFISYCRGNALKYVWRAGAKGPAAQDLAKAQTYLGFALNTLNGQSPKGSPEDPCTTI